MIIECSTFRPDSSTFLHWLINLKMVNKGGILIFLIGILALCFAEFNNGRPTYEHTLENGQKVRCNMCYPGTHWVDHCTVKGDDTKCSHCSEGFFTPDYNQWVYCAQCGKKCDSREHMTAACTAMSNISCKCLDGYYRETIQYGICREISPCPAGEGVIIPGNESADTQCQACGEGFFSANSSKTAACEKCSVCPEEMVAVTQCQPDADTVCRSKNDVSTDGTIIGVIVGVVFVVVVVVVALMCFCCKRCAGIRKKLRMCCNRPYQECTQNDQSSMTKAASPDDVKIGMPPDLLTNTHNGVGDVMYKERNGVGVANGNANHPPEQISPLSDNIFYMLREDLIAQDFPQFFRFLFTKDADRYIEEMKMNYNMYGVKEVLYQILVRWRDIEKGDATAEKILEALKEWKRMDLHKKYSDIFDTSDVSMDTVEKGKEVTEV